MATRRTGRAATTRRTKSKRTTNRTRTSGAAAASRRGAPRRAPGAGAARADAALTFNHAMIYSRDLARAAAFYRDALGFVVVDEYPGAYVRLRAPGSTATIALHGLDEGQRLDAAAGGVRLYFEVRGLDAFCRRLATLGVACEQMPQTMPWGWQHAYLKDPDGHEISLYWAGAKRLRRTRMTGGDH